MYGWGNILSIDERIDEQYTLQFCQKAHFGQKRKYLNIPYYLHPLEVAEITRTVSEDAKCHSPSEIYRAALLHDVIEDTDITLDRLEFLFGGRIADLVYQVTDVSKPEDGNRAARKLLDRQKLGNACPDGQTIKLADLISNTQSILTFDKNFAVVYLNEKEKTLEYLQQGAPRLLEIANEILISSRELLKKPKEKATFTPEAQKILKLFPELENEAVIVAFLEHDSIEVNASDVERARELLDQQKMKK